MNQQQIGKFILESRKKKNITQKELANKIGVTNKAISKWENGRGLPDYSLFQPLCEALDISVADLLNGKESNSSTGIVDYLKYKEKQNVKKILFLIILIFLIILVAILSVYFVNSYKKINVYELNGRSENFYYENGLIIKSNIKQVMQYGKLSTNTIDEEDIISISLVVKNGENYYLISNFMSNFIASEKYGYNEFFNDMKLEHIPDDMYIIIFYESGDEIIREDLKIESSQILSNDKFINLKNEAEYTSNIEPLDLHQFDNIIELRKKALKDGFDYNSEYSFYLGCGNDCLTKRISTNEYVGFHYRAYLDTFSYYIEKKDFILNLDLVRHKDGVPTELVFGFEGNADIITYDLTSNEIICAENLMKYKDYVISAKNLFLEYYLK